MTARATRSVTRRSIEAAIAIATLLAPGLAHAGGRATPAGRWFSLGLVAGASRPAAALADYQWDLAPRFAWGAQALVGHGGFAAGARVWRSHATQTIGVPGSPDAAVALASAELIGRGRLATLAGQRLFATASVGRLHLAYDPDRVTFDAGSGPTTVALAPIDTWNAGLGLALERTLAPSLVVGFALDHRIFTLETAHRNGDAIEVGRRRFGDWSARLELAWLRGQG